MLPDCCLTRYAHILASLCTMFHSSWWKGRRIGAETDFDQTPEGQRFGPVGEKSSVCVGQGVQWISQHITSSV